MIHMVSISLWLNPDMYGRLQAEKRQNMIVLPMFTEFPLSPLLVSANELSGNVQRPFGIPLKRKTNQISLEMAREQILITFAFFC